MLASSGNRTRAARVAGEHSTTEPTMPGQHKMFSQSVGFEPTLPEGNWFRVSRLNHSATTAVLLHGIKEDEHRWFSGRMLACHAGGPGSIPGRCKHFFCHVYAKTSKRTQRGFKKQKCAGDGGYRSPYLSHAKRALYHLSYVPLNDWTSWLAD